MVATYHNKIYLVLAALLQGKFFVLCLDGPPQFRQQLEDYFANNNSFFPILFLFSRKRATSSLVHCRNRIEENYCIM